MYGDASGYQQQTTGSTDYEMIRECFAANGMHWCDTGRRGRIRRFATG